MAIVANDFIKFNKMLNGMPQPTLAVVKETAVTWDKGAVIIATNGYAVEAADGPTTGTILGIAAEPAVSGPLFALVIPALPSVEFRGILGSGDTGADYTSLITDRYIGLGVSLEGTSGVWYVNAADTTDIAVTVTGFIDTIGDNLAEITFVFSTGLFNGL